jgi:hypothetical protein
MIKGGIVPLRTDYECTGISRVHAATLTSAATEHAVRRLVAWY